MYTVVVFEMKQVNGFCYHRFLPLSKYIKLWNNVNKNMVIEIYIHFGLTGHNVAFTISVIGRQETIIQSYILKTFHIKIQQFLGNIAEVNSQV